MKTSIQSTILVGFLTLWLAADGFSQGTVVVTPEQRKAANEVYTARTWAKSAELYQAIADAEPGNAGALFRLGVSFHQLKMYDQAMVAYHRSEKIAANPTVRYNIACINALKNEPDSAFEWLDKAIAAGFKDIATLRNDSDLSAIRNDAKFKALEERLDRAARPCAFSAEARQFDFWIGEWNVKTPQGQPAGTSSIQQILGQCVILENWTSSDGISGKSFNVYDSSDKRWHQAWVDDKGTYAHYVGGLQDGKMVVVAEMRVGGKKTLARMTFSKMPNGDVRQFGENSIDEGKTWTTAFDLIYQKKK